MAEFRVISSDNHIFEPPDLWTSRMDPKLKDRAPHIERVEEGGDWWFCDGHKVNNASGGTQAGLRFEEPEKLSIEVSIEDVRPGAYIPEDHVKDMEIDGVEVAVIHPTAGLLLYGVPDSRLLVDVFRAYNDWLAEFCQPFPKRLKGIAMLNTDFVDEAVNELERCANMGLAGAMISTYPTEDMSYDLPMYEPLWAAAEDLGIPLSLHVGTNRPGPGQQFATLDVATANFLANTDHWIRMSLGHMIFSGVFERYPKLQVGSVENELSWAPHFLDRIDYNYTQRAQEFSRGYRLGEGMLPSDYFHRNIFLGFQEDVLGIKDRHIIGVDNLTWGSDYPHQESTFPRSREIIDEILAECTEDEKAKIVGGNISRVYHLD